MFIIVVVMSGFGVGGEGATIGLRRHARAVGPTLATYPEAQSLDDVRSVLEIQVSPREAMLLLADQGLARAVRQGDDRYWRATSIGVWAIRSGRR